MVENETILLGMKSICGYFGRSEPTVLALIREQEFPACKIAGGWVSDKDLIRLWVEAQVGAEIIPFEKSVNRKKAKISKSKPCSPKKKQKHQKQI